jgi:hypothetical protein
MDKSGANIDIVFRNGLKDFEVLPPPEVWDSIHPVIKTKLRSFTVFKAAALITVILSMSFFAYRMSRELSAGLKSDVIALNEETAFPFDNPAKIPEVNGNENKIIPGSDNLFTDNATDMAEITVNENDLSPVVAYIQENNSLSMGKAKTLVGPPSASLTSAQNFAFEINEPDQLYFPINNNQKGTERWSIAAMASPTYYSKINSGNDALSKQMKATEQSIMSYTGGVAFSYKINNRFSIQSGLYYSSLGQELDGISSYGGFKMYYANKGDHNFEVLTTSGSVYTDNADVFLLANGSGERILTNYTADVFDPGKASLKYLNNTLRQNFSYLEMPITLRYKLIDKVVDFNLIGGVSYNLLVNNSVFAMVDGSKYPIGKTEGINLLSVSSSLGMGMEYSFSDKLSLNLEPTFRYYLNPFNEVTGSKIHPYSFGIFSGLSYKF